MSRTYESKEISTNAGRAHAARVLRRILPARIRRKLAGFFVSCSDESLTISQWWEAYAENFRSENGKRLGDAWSDPEIIGVDVPAERIVQYLDERVFTPYLGVCDVLLEIGSGGGRFTEILRPKCRKLIATDTSPAMLRLVRDRFPNDPKIDCRILDGLELSGIPDRSVDAVFSYDVFVHLQHWDIYNYLCEVRRILKPQGKAIIQHANTFSEFGWRTFKIDLPQSLNKPKLPWTLTVMTPELMRSFAERAGLQVVDCLTNVVRRDCITLLRSGDRGA